MKYLTDDDFIICGYRCDISSVSLILGQFKDNELIYKGRVSLAKQRYEVQIIKSIEQIASPFPTYSGEEGIVWIKPELVCAIRFMMVSKTGALRQPVFKGLRSDKSPVECKI